MYSCVTARTSLEPRRTHLALSQITVTVIRLRVVFGAPQPLTPHYVYCTYEWSLANYRHWFNRNLLNYITAV